MRYFILGLLAISTANVFAQILEPVQWNYRVSEQSVSPGDELELIFEVVLDDRWYVYATDFVPTEKFGPVPTKFEFEPHPTYELVGEVVSLQSKEKTNDLLGLTFRYMDESPAIFKQKVKILSKNPVIKGHYEYQVCTLVDGKCIPGDDEFVFNVEVVE